MPGRSDPASIDEYIAGFPAGTQYLLGEMRQIIKASAPGAVETISYAIPALDLNGRHLAHFAAYEKHIGFYPSPSAIEAFRGELAGYPSAKGSVRFPLDGPLPTDLIRRMVEFRVGELSKEN